MCLYACMRVDVCICVHMYVLYACVCMYEYMYVRMYVCVCVHVSVRMISQVLACVRVTYVPAIPNSRQRAVEKITLQAQFLSQSVIKV